MLIILCDLRSILQKEIAKHYNTLTVPQERQHSEHQQKL